MNPKAIISTIDYPGEVALVIFLSGCPLRCHYCQNPELQTSVEEEVRALTDEIDKAAPYITAVVLSGGEPLDQPYVCHNLLSVANIFGLRTAVQTSGYYPSRLRKLMDRIDKVFLDVKAPLDKPILFKKICGVSFAGEVRRSISIAGDKLQLTTVLFPETDLQGIVDSLATDHLVILQGMLDGVPQMTLNDMQEKVSKLTGSLPEFELRSIEESVVIEPKV